MFQLVQELPLVLWRVWLELATALAEFVKEGERMQPKVCYYSFHVQIVHQNVPSMQVMRSLKHALQPAIIDVSVVFQVPNGYEVSHNLQPISDGEKLVVYAVLKSNGRR